MLSWRQQQALFSTSVSLSMSACNSQQPDKMHSNNDILYDVQTADHLFHMLCLYPSWHAKTLQQLGTYQARMAVMDHQLCSRQRSAASAQILQRQQLTIEASNGGIGDCLSGDSVGLPQHRCSSARGNQDTRCATAGLGTAFGDPMFLILMQHSLAYRPTHQRQQ